MPARVLVEETADVQPVKAAFVGLWCVVVRRVRFDVPEEVATSARPVTAVSGRTVGGCGSWSTVSKVAR